MASAELRALPRLEPEIAKIIAFPKAIPGPVASTVLEEVVSAPILHRNNVQIAIDMILGVEKLRQLSDSKAIAHRQRKVRRERDLVRIQHRPFDNITAHRIGPV